MLVLIMANVANLFGEKLWTKILNTSWIVIGFNLVIGQHPTLAQVTSDGTLSTTIHSSDNLNFVILQGDQAETNLFHSFEQFSIPTNGSVHFKNPIHVQNIISRVTGPGGSDIDGLIQANGTANVFLLNPNGFLFGPNARLDIGGSFLATTAERYVFDDDVTFSASNLQSSLLSIHTPIGLQMGQTSEAIELQGPGHQLFQTNTVAPIQNNATSITGLEVLSGQSLVLIGNLVQLDGAVLTAPGGHIELGSLKEGRIELNTTNPQHAGIWTFNYDKAVFNDIQLSNLAFVDVSNSHAGSVNIEADNVALTRGSAVLSQTSSGLGGDINIQAHDSILINGFTPDEQFRTLLSAETMGRGQGGTVFITTPTLRIRNGGRLGTSTFGSGQAGNVDILAENKVQVAGVSPFLVPLFGSEVSTIQATTIGGTGNAGDINIQTQNLSVQDGALIASTTLLGSGNSGDIMIQADSIRLTGNNTQITGSGISSATLSNGNAGTVTVNTRLLQIQDGTIIDSSSISDGNAGNLIINASERIRITGAIPSPLDADDVLRSQISSEVVEIDGASLGILNLDDSLDGNAGTILIQTPDLQISNGAVISLISEGTGNSGKLNVMTETLELSSQGAIAATTTTGNGGNIDINTNHLILDNGLINASTTTSGSGGNIAIQAQDIVLVGTGSEELRQNTILPAFTDRFSTENITQGISSFALGTAQAGNIEINTEQLSLQNGSIIASSAFNNSAGGNIQVNATDIEITGSVLTTSTFGSGTAGNIEVNTRNLEFWEGGQFLSATFSQGDAGNLTVQSTGQILLNGRSPSDGLFASGLSAGAQRLLSSESEKEVSGSGGDITVTSPLLLIQEEAEISASAATINFNTLLGNRRSNDQSRTPSENRSSPSPSSARAGNITMDIGTLVLDNGIITVLSEQGGGGNVSLNIDQGLILDNMSSISTQAGTGEGAGGNGGNITITSPFLVGIDNSDIIANAFDGNGGNIQITTEGLFNLRVRDQLTDGNDITASSQSGINGTVSITTPNVDPGNDALILPTTVTDTTQTISTACNISQGSRFVMTGQGGLATEPNSDRPWSRILPDLGDIPRSLPSVDPSSASPPMAIAPHSLMPKDSMIATTPLLQEATAFARTSDGSIQLTAGEFPTLAPPQTCSSAQETG